MLTYETIVAAMRATNKQEPYAHKYLTHNVYDLGTSLGYDMSGYIRIEPSVFPSKEKTEDKSKHYMKFQKARRSKRART